MLGQKLFVFDESGDGVSDVTALSVLENKIACQRQVARMTAVKTHQEFEISRFQDDDGLRKRAL